MPVGDDQFREVGRFANPAHRTEHEFPRPLIDPAAGLLLVFSDEGLPHVLDGELLVFLQAVRVDGDLDRPLTAADQDHGTDTGQGFEVFLDPATGDLGDFPRVATPRHRHRQHRCGIEGELVDDRGIGALGQLAQDRPHLGIDLLGRNGAILFEFELDRQL